MMSKSYQSSFQYNWWLTGFKICCCWCRAISTDVVLLQIIKFVLYSRLTPLTEVIIQGWIEIFIGWRHQPQTYSMRRCLLGTWLADNSSTISNTCGFMQFYFEHGFLNRDIYFRKYSRKKIILWSCTIQNYQLWKRIPQFLTRSLYFYNTQIIHIHIFIMAVWNLKVKHPWSPKYLIMLYLCYVLQIGVKKSKLLWLSF